MMLDCYTAKHCASKHKKDMCKKTVFADKEVRGKQYAVTEI